MEEVNFHDYQNLQDFVGKFVKPKHNHCNLAGRYGQADLGFCYFDQLRSVHYIPPKYIPIVIKAAHHFAGTDDNNSIIQVSVTSTEEHYREWVGYASNYPGATITKLLRQDGDEFDYTAYSLLFPSNNDGEDSE